jgi:hypothetical protein
MYVALGQDVDKVVEPSPYPVRAGYQRHGDAIPVNRWVPPMKFNDPMFSKLRHVGRSRFGPAYKIPGASYCPDCMQGVGAYYATRANWPVQMSAHAAQGATDVRVQSAADFVSSESDVASEKKTPWLLYGAVAIGGALLLKAAL